MMTLNQAAEALGVTPATLRQQIAAGRLTASKIGPLWVVEELEVDRYRRESQGRPGRPRRATR
jgi:excisionase family DNA binding protein